MYNIDTAFLGHLGTDELAGAALASVCVQLVTTFVYAPAYALNCMVAQAIGAGNPKLGGKQWQLSMGACSIACIPAIIICVNVKSVLGIWEDNDDVLHYSKLFGQYLSLRLWPTAMYMGISLATTLSTCHCTVRAVTFPPFFSFRAKRNAQRCDKYSKPCK